MKPHFTDQQPPVAILGDPIYLKELDFFFFNIAMSVFVKAFLGGKVQS